MLLKDKKEIINELQHNLSFVDDATINKMIFDRFSYYELLFEDTTHNKKLLQNNINIYSDIYNQKVKLAPFSSKYNTLIYNPLDNVTEEIIEETETTGESVGKEDITTSDSGLTSNTTTNNSTSSNTSGNNVETTYGKKTENTGSSNDTTTNSDTTTFGKTVATSVSGYNTTTMTPESSTAEGGTQGNSGSSTSQGSTSNTLQDSGKDKTVQSGTLNTTNAGTVTDNGTSSNNGTENKETEHKEKGTNKHELHRHGNIGTMASADLLEKEMALIRNLESDYVETFRDCFTISTFFI